MFENVETNARSRSRNRPTTQLVWIILAGVPSPKYWNSANHLFIRAVSDIPSLSVLTLFVLSDIFLQRNFNLPDFFYCDQGYDFKLKYWTGTVLIVTKRHFWTLQRAYIALKYAILDGAKSIWDGFEYDVHFDNLICSAMLIIQSRRSKAWQSIHNTQILRERERWQKQTTFERIKY